MNYVTKQEFEALESRVAKLEEDAPSEPVVQKAKSIREFILEKKPKSEADKAICLIYYYEIIKKNIQDGISTGDLKLAFREARERVPTNPSDVLSKCAKKGWIDKADEKDNKNRWIITNTGIAYVEQLGES